MKLPTACTAAISLICLSIGANAGMHMSDISTYNLSDAEIAKKCAKWSHGDRLEVDETGLGWDGDEKSSIDLELMLQPIAIGHGWRPAGHAGVTVQLNFEDEEKSLPYCTTYVRYSPDGANWSTWQVLKRGPSAKKGAGAARAGTHFSGSISVPRRETKAYREKQREYWKLDVPWASDEHALCEWIVKDDPKFFEKNLPFPGFIQVYVEGSLKGGNRLKSVLVNHTTSTSGMHAPPKDPKDEVKRLGPWAWWTVKKDAKDPICGFDEVFKSPEAPR